MYPAMGDQLVTLLGDNNATQEAIVNALLVSSALPYLQGCQVDGSPGADPSAPPAPSGKAYAWVIVSDEVPPEDLSGVLATLQSILDSFA